MVIPPTGKANQVFNIIKLMAELWVAREMLSAQGTRTDLLRDKSPEVKTEG